MFIYLHISIIVVIAITIIMILLLIVIIKGGCEQAPAPLQLVSPTSSSCHSGVRRWLLQVR